MVKYLLILVVYFLFGNSGNTLAANEQPNILWIYVEDMSPWLGCYNDKINKNKTPNIDLIAKKGVLFERAFAPAPVCSATRSAMMLGQSAIRFGAHQHRSSRAGTPIYLPENYKLLPEILNDVGYTTFNFGKDDYNFIWDSSVYSYKLQSSTNFLSLVDKQPFFGQIQTKGGKGNLWKFPNDRRVDPAKITVPKDYPDDDVFKKIVAQHYDAIRLEDDGVGKILDGLEKAGILDNTIIVFFSDHGANHLVRHKQMVTEGGLHVPLIMCGPTRFIPENKRRTDLVNLLDLSATTLWWAGVEIPYWYEGKNLFSPSFVSHKFIGAHKDRLDHTIDRVRSIRTERFRYIKNYKLDRIFLQPQYRDNRAAILHLKKLLNDNKLSDMHRNIYFGERPSEEFYDIVNDPAMTINLATNSNYKGELDKHRELLNIWLSHGDMGANEETIDTLKVNGENQIWGEGVNVEYERYRVDSDGDGLSDKWEEINNRNPIDDQLIYLFDCGGWQTEGWKSDNIKSNIAGFLGTLDFKLENSSNSIKKNGLNFEFNTSMQMDIDASFDKDILLHVLVNDRLVGRKKISSTSSIISTSIPLNLSKIKKNISNIELVFSGMKNTEVIIDKICVNKFQQALRPNIIYILADDLGYGEVGYNGQKLIKTPELDKLAYRGMRFTDHYCGNSVCAPSRCSLLTGLHPGHAYIRANSPGYPNGQTPLPKNTETIAKLAKRGGYKTAIIGKWGLGGVLEDRPNPILNSGHPNNQGFDYFFGYLDQRKAHNYYPTHLWRNDEYIKLNNSTNGWDKSNRDYSHDLMTEEALKWIRDNKDKPMFLYLAYCIPHVWWQVPDLGEYDKKDWPEKHLNVQAAMVSRMDRDIGRINKLIESLGLAKNTLIIFNSDNGAHGRGLTKNFFNTTGGLSGKKRYMTEGGIRSPMIAYWPGMIKENTISSHLSAFWDMLPTMSDLIGEPIKGRTDGISMLNELLGKSELQKNHEYLYWELYEGKPNCSIRFNNWKGIVKDRRDGMKVELYNLQSDFRELNNVADKNPTIVNKMIKLMKEAHEPSLFWDKDNTPLYNAPAACKYTGVSYKPLSKENK